MANSFRHCRSDLRNLCDFLRDFRLGRASEVGQSGDGRRQASAIEGRRQRERPDEAKHQGNEVLSTPGASLTLVFIR